MLPGSIYPALPQACPMAAEQLDASKGLVWLCYPWLHPQPRAGVQQEPLPLGLRDLMGPSCCGQVKHCLNTMSGPCSSCLPGK